MSQAKGPNHHWGRAVTHNFTWRFSFFSLMAIIQQEVNIFLRELFCSEIKSTLHTALRIQKDFVDTLTFLTDITDLCRWNVNLFSHFHVYLFSVNILRCQCLKCFMLYYADNIFVLLYQLACKNSWINLSKCYQHNIT